MRHSRSACETGSGQRSCRIAPTLSVVHECGRAGPRSRLGRFRAVCFRRRGARIGTSGGRPDRSEVGVDEDDCSPTRARARCAAGSRGSGGHHAHRRLPKSRRRRAAGLADHDAGPSRAWRCAPLANPRARPARRPSAAKAGLRPCPGQRLARESSSASISQLSRLRPTRGASWSATGARGSRVDPAIWKQARDYRHRDNDLPSGCGGSLSMPEAVRCAGVVVRV